MVTGQLRIVPISLRFPPPSGATMTAWQRNGSERRRFIDLRPGSGQLLPMDIDDFLRARPDDPLALLGRQDLDPLSVDELEVRIAVLEAEITRSRQRMVRARDHRTSADALFRKS